MKKQEIGEGFLVIKHTFFMIKRLINIYNKTNFNERLDISQKK